MTAGPNIYRNKSPAPTWTGQVVLILYVFNTERNGAFCTSDNNLCVPNVMDVQIINGWMIDVIFFGNLAPKVNVVRVVNNMNRVWIGVFNSCDMDEKEDKTVATPVRIVPIVNVWNVSSENAFGGGEFDGFAGVDVAVLLVDDDDDDDDDGTKLRIPVTEYAVENKVKKNPIISTPATFNNCIFQ